MSIDERTLLLKWGQLPGGSYVVDNDGRLEWRRKDQFEGYVPDHLCHAYRDLVFNGLVDAHSGELTTQGYEACAIIYGEEPQ